MQFGESIEEVILSLKWDASTEEESTKEQIQKVDVGTENAKSRVWRVKSEECGMKSN